MSHVPSASYLVPLIVLVFPFAFVAMWLLVSAILAAVSNYRSLLPGFRIDDASARSARALPTPWYAMIGLVSYRGGIVGLGADDLGLVVRVSKLFPFHPAVRIPWNRVTVGTTSGSGFVRRFLGTSIELDARVTLRVPADVAKAIDDERARHV